MSSEQPFFMVYGAGQGAPTFQHQDFVSARNEAMRLARQHPGIKFYVLVSVGRALKIDVEYEDINVTLDGIPF